MPKITEQQILDALNNRENFKKLTPNNTFYLSPSSNFDEICLDLSDGARYLKQMVNDFPQYRDRIATLILDDLPHNNLDEEQVIEPFETNINFPLNEFFFTSPVIDNSSEFKRLTRNGIYEVKLIAELFPEHNDKIAALILDDLSEFQRLTARVEPTNNGIEPDGYEEAMLAKQWRQQKLKLKIMVEVLPQSIEKIADLVLGNPSEFKRLTTRDGVKDLEFLAEEVFPQSVDRLAQMVLNDRSEFQRFTAQGSFYLPILAKIFPQHHAQIIQIILTPQEFSRFTKNDFNLEYLLKAFPHLADIVIQRVLDNPAELKRLTATGPQSLPIMTKYASPEYTDQLAKRFLDDPETFTQLTKSGSDWKAMTEAFPRQANTLSQIFLSRLDVEFQQFMKNNYQVISLVEAFPQHQDMLARRILNDPSELFRLTAMCPSHDLQLLGKAFPRYAHVFRQSNVPREVLNTWNALKIVEPSAAQTLGQMGICANRKRHSNDESSNAPKKTGIPPSSLP